MIQRNDSLHSAVLSCKTQNLNPKALGFTLIELMIALTILAFLGYFTSETMRTSTQRSQKIRTEIDLSREVKAAARVIKGDISRAYNTRDIYIAVYNEAQRERIREWQRNQANPQQQQQNQNAGDGNEDGAGNNNNDPNNMNSSGGMQQQEQIPPPPYEPREELIVTQFLGEKDKLDLTTLSGVRVRKNVKASDLVEVGYYLENCRRRGKRDETTNCLWRRLSYFLDGEVNVGGQATVLLEDVTQFELKYLRVRGENQEWIDRWLSDQNGDDVSRDALPLAVQVQLEVERPLDKSGENKQRFSIHSYIPIYFTNNANVKSIIQMNSQGNPLEAPLGSNPMGAEGINAGDSGLSLGRGIAPQNNNSPFGGGSQRFNNQRGGGGGRPNSPFQQQGGPGSGRRGF